MVGRTSLALLLMAAPAQSQTLDEHAIQEAIDQGLKAKRGVAAQGRSAELPDGSNIFKVGEPRTYYEVVIMGPLTRVSSAAGEHARRYLPFTIDGVTPAMLAPLLRVAVVPTCPTQDRDFGWVVSPTVEHVVVHPKAQRGQARGDPIQPAAMHPEFVNCLHGSGLSIESGGMVAEYSLDALPRDVDWEVLIVTGERDYKATIPKKKLTDAR